MADKNLRITIREGEASTTLEFDELLDSVVDAEGAVVEAFKRSLRAVRDIAKLYEMGALTSVPLPRAPTVEPEDAQPRKPDPTACKALPVKPEEIIRFEDDGGPAL